MSNEDYFSFAKKDTRGPQINTAEDTKGQQNFFNFPKRQKGTARFCPFSKKRASKKDVYVSRDFFVVYKNNIGSPIFFGFLEKNNTEGTEIFSAFLKKTLDIPRFFQLLKKVLRFSDVLPPFSKD